jgi:uncharacterized protein YdiU (UPF0061 family)
MRVGFVHGVLNTDNMSILGLTIDYGPFGWIEDYDPDWTPNTTDAHGRRYRFGWQPRIAYWNLTRLAHALSPLVDGPEPLRAGLQRYQEVLAGEERRHAAAKLGLSACREDDLDLMAALLSLLHAAEVDMTLWFRGLAELDPDRPALEPMAAAFYDEAKRATHAPAFADWLRRYAARIDADDAGDSRRARMDAANPLYVPRNWLLQQAIDRAEAGDPGGVHALQSVFEHPYTPRSGLEPFARPRPDWARDRAGCSMLSCSS